MPNAPFMRLNGCPVKAVPGSVKDAPNHWGEHSPSRTNRPQRRRRALTRKWDFTTKPLLPAQADTLEGLLDGVSHHWRFDFDAFSTNGLGPELGGTYTITQNDGNARFGYGYLDLSGGGDITFDVRTTALAKTSSGKFTIAYWRATVAGTWEHVMVRTSDAAIWLNGVRADATNIDELTVSGNAFALADLGGPQYFDGMMVHLFDVDDEYPECFYDWSTAYGLESWWKLEDLTVKEEISGTTGTVGGTPTVGVGIRNNGLTFVSASLEYADPPNSTAAFMTGATQISCSVWAKRAAVGAAQCIVGIRGSVDDTFFKIFFLADGRIRLAFQETALAVVISYDTIDTFESTSDWYHIAAAVDLDAGTVMIAVNGRSRATTVNGARALLSTFTQTVGDVNFGASPNVLFRSNYFDGVIDEVRMHSRALDEGIAQEIYRRGLLNKDPLPPVSASDFPRLTLDGQIIECERIEVEPESGDQGYTLFGSSSGWQNAGRVVSGILEEVAAAERRRIPQPFFLALMREDEISGASLVSNVGDYVGTISGTTGDFGQLGPYRQNEAALFGSDPLYIDYSVDVAKQLVGARAASMAAWVRYADTGLTQTVIHASRESTSATKLRLAILNDEIQFSWNAGGGFQSVTSGSTIPSDSEYHLLVGTIDLVAEEIRTYIDGIEVSFGTQSISRDTFDEVVNGFRIGQRVSGVEQLDSELAMAAVWRRELSAGEVWRMFDLGRKGVLR